MQIYSRFVYTLLDFIFILDTALWLLAKSITGKQLVVVGNFTHTATDIVFPATPGNWTNYFTGKSETVNKQVNVPAHGYVVYTNF